MRVLNLRRKEGVSLADVDAMIEGHVFHVTRFAYWEAISVCGEVRPNTDGQLPSSFGFSDNSYFKNRGCVSLFDYRTPPDDTILDFRRRCHPFQPAKPGGDGIAILVLSKSAHGNLVPWTRCKEENALCEMVVPYVEIGHPGPISFSKIDQVIFLHIEEDPTSFAATLRRIDADHERTVSIN